MNNPFIDIDQRLTTIESLLTELKAGILQPQPETRQVPISIEQVCALTNLARPTLYSLVASKKIPHFKQGKKLYFFESEVIEWIRQGKRKTLSEIESEAQAHIDQQRSGKTKTSI